MESNAKSKGISWWWAVREFIAGFKYFRLRRSLVTVLALYIFVSLCFVADKFQISLIDPSNYKMHWLTTILFVLIFIELTCLFGCAFQYLLNEIFCAIDVRIHNRKSLNARARHIFDSCVEKPGADTAQFVRSVMDPRTLATEALKGLGVIGFLGTRLLLSLSAATVGLTLIFKLTANNEGWFPELANTESVFSTVGWATYLTLTTISTVGFGDQPPTLESPAGVFLVFVEILASSVFLLFMVNLSVGWVFQLRASDDEQTVNYAAEGLIEESRGTREALIATAQWQDRTALPALGTVSDSTGLYINSATFSYGQKQILNKFSYDFSDGNIHVLMGKNGCGKSTLLKLIVGELEVDSGIIRFGADAKAERPRFEYMPQNYRQAIFPWKTVSSNARPWDSEDSPDFDHDSNLHNVLLGLDLNSLANEFPYELSGGQQQKAMLCRCAVSKADVVFLDEPFSAIDVLRRKLVSTWLRQAWESSGKLVLAAMHEPDHAVHFADHIVVFSGPPLDQGTKISRSDFQTGKEVDYTAYQNAVVDALGLAEIRS